MIFWNVGQGDFITLITPVGCWAFDVGGSVTLSLKTVTYLRDHCKGRRLDLFVSHFDKDHIRNYARLATHLIIGKAYFSHLEPRSQFGKRLLDQLKFQSSVITEIRAGFQAKLGGFHLLSLWPPPGIKLGKAENDRSEVLLLEGFGVKILMTGDFPGKLERKLEQKLGNTQVDILKVAHHGSRSSSTAKFLNKLKPKVCVVSVGAHNTYGHPTHETLERLNDIHCTILRTDRLGDIDLKLN